MKILVCVKRVPDTSALIKVSADGKSVDLSGVEHVVAPFDEFGLEEALKLKEAEGGEVVAVTVGDEASEEQLRSCLALGADRAVIVKDPAADGSDGLGIARMLAGVIAREAPDIVFLGKQATDTDSHAMGAQLSVLTSRPFASAINSLELSGGTLKVTRPIEGGAEVIEMALPAILSAEKGLNEPRYATLKGIMMAKKKPIDAVTLADLGVDAGTVGEGARRVVIEGVTPPPSRSAGQVIKDVTPEEAAKQQLTLLRDEAKAI